MRGWLLVIVAIAACKGGKDKDASASGSAKVGAAVLAAPKVETPSVLAATDGKPPPFVLVLDDKGTLHVNAFATWDELSTKNLLAGAKTAPPPAIDRFVRETFALGQRPKDALASWDPSALDTLEDLAPPGGFDDPPPPEEEDRPEDGEDESGGIGTAMALEEGKMGKQDTARAPGQYEMKNADEDPALARKRRMGQRGPLGYVPLSGPGTGMGPGFETPQRVATVAGEVMENGKLDPLRAMLVTPPATKATLVIDTVMHYEAAIGVAHAGKLRPLRLQFVHDRDTAWSDPPWVEARVSAKGIVIEAVPSEPVTVDSLDPKQLAAAIEKVKTARGVPPAAPVDVLVDADLDAQRLVDVLVALDTAGVRMIGMGAAPSPEELAKRGHSTPSVAVGQPNAQGDLDKAIIRRYVKRNRQKIQYCYEKQLLANPKLEGTVQVQFFIDPEGRVASVSASGVDPEVSSCVASVIKMIEFPAPKGGGGVQVNYPFTMRH